MKTYKPTGFPTFLILFTEILLIMIPGIVVVGFIGARQGVMETGDALTSYLLVGALFGVVLGVIFFLISLIGRLFTKEEIALSEETITYKGNTLHLHNVRYISVHLPEQESKHKISPMLVYLWCDNEHYMDICKPSFRLIHQLKKHCPYAKFTIDDLPGRIKKRLIFSAVMTIVFVLHFLFD